MEHRPDSSLENFLLGNSSFSDVDFKDVFRISGGLAGTTVGNTLATKLSLAVSMRVGFVVGGYFAGAAIALVAYSVAESLLIDDQ